MMIKRLEEMIKISPFQAVSILVEFDEYLDAEETKTIPKKPRLNK